MPTSPTCRPPTPTRSTSYGDRSWRSPRDATESISYGVPTLSLHGHLVGFAAFAKHLSFFPMSTTILVDLAADVAPYLVGKSTLRFTAKEPLPAALIKKVVKARIAENLAVLAARAAKKGAPRAQRAEPTKSISTTPKAGDSSTRKTKR
jgi:uncharacterized protein YdhG (YjbR/CyaY superfamily)